MRNDFERRLNGRVAKWNLVVKKIQFHGNQGPLKPFHFSNHRLSVLSSAKPQRGDALTKIIPYTALYKFTRRRSKEVDSNYGPYPDRWVRPTKPQWGEVMDSGFLRLDRK